CNMSGAAGTGENCTRDWAGPHAIPPRASQPNIAIPRLPARGWRQLRAIRAPHMKIMAGNSNLPLARAIADYLELPLTDASVRRFADEEVFVEIQENVRGEDVF